MRFFKETQTVRKFLLNYLVNVRMPVFIMDCFSRVLIHAREKRRGSQVYGIRL